MVTVTDPAVVLCRMSISVSIWIITDPYGCYGLAHHLT